MASAFFRGEAGLAAFSNGAADDKRVGALAAKVRYVVDPANPYPRQFTGHLRATLRDGSVIELRQPHFRGGAHEPLARSEIEAKFFANAAYGGWSKRARARRARCCVTHSMVACDLAHFARDCSASKRQPYRHRFL